jgi:hypothetical protein
MIVRNQPSIVIVTRPTRLDGLRRRWGTLGQAKFSLKAARAIANAEIATDSSKVTRRRSDASSAALVQADFADYAAEDDVYQRTVDDLEATLQFGCPVKTIDRSFVPNYDFGLASVVVVVGQDGLVANVAKYVGDVPIVAVNPDPTRIDGVLLPFDSKHAFYAVKSVLAGSARMRHVTLAEAQLSDGQRLLAFNDFFVGAASHISARYVITCDRKSEPHSSSGVIVSTGAGSTGWMSSVFNMAAGIARSIGAEVSHRPPLEWDDNRLLWAVREPFQSRTSKISMVFGEIEAPQELVVESLMPENGVIFSDGMEADFLPFISGSIVRIGISQQKAKLVCR